MIVIRKAERADAAAIAHVHVESWRTTYAGIVPDAYLESLDEAARAKAWESLVETNDCLVAARDGHVVGFITGGAIREPVEECDAELYAIYLLAEAQRARIGAGLLRELVRLLRQKGFRSMAVWVLEKNPSKNFYIRTGAHHAATKDIVIGGLTLLEEAFAWPDLAQITFPAITA
ncbi:MAG TPA: GNAT family N-acetyltransferase [Terracidiphilus sp.]|nr:GNAT family N-acetyltransferase [Terracidiphilus sp.]HYK64931.1 GNAT family N-acetyltransferase [Patescibacteria group bacterium]